MKNFSMDFGRLAFSSFFALIPFHQGSILASEIFLATNNGEIEEIKVKRVKKNGNLVVKFCNSLTDYSGYVEVQNKKFLVSDADVIKDKKLVWKDTNLSKTKVTLLVQIIFYLMAKLLLMETAIQVFYLYWC